MSMEQWWNDPGRGKPKHSEKISCNYATSYTKSSTWGDLGLIPLLVVGGLANRLSHGISKSPFISVFTSLLSIYRTSHGDHDHRGQTQDS